MLPVTSWAIWYGDFTVIRGSTEAEWKAAPNSGVQALTYYHGGKRRTMQWGVDFYNLPGYRTNLRKSGTEIDLAAHLQIINNCINDPLVP